MRTRINQSPMIGGPTKIAATDVRRCSRRHPGFRHRRTLRNTAHCAAEPYTLAEADGYRGIWYSNQKTGDEYVYKYSGGMATYPQQHTPIAIYAAAVDKTFFVYGGTAARQSSGCCTWCRISITPSKTVPRPRILLEQEDQRRARQPHVVDRRRWLSVDLFQLAWHVAAFVHSSQRQAVFDRSLSSGCSTTNFSYGQPWYLPRSGACVLMHTRYSPGREMFG